MQPTVLIAVLNWGLGHATRSISIINELLSKNYDVHIASDGDALLFLKKEFPDLQFHELPSYNISYPYSSIVLNILRSSYHIFNAISNEKKVLDVLIKKINPKIIISDNRYGIWHKDIKSILLTHQINLYHKVSIIAKFGTYFINYYLNKFDEIWIPDFEGEKSLGGLLSKAPKLKKYKYIGPLSRFISSKTKKKYDIAVVLSGPEPQRSIFEELVLKQLENIDKKIIVIRGKVDLEEEYWLSENIFVKSYCLSTELNKILNQSELIISRSGYTTIMDIVKLGEKAVFVPTPGQTEQEYLSEYLKNKGFFYSQKQKYFDLEDAIKQSEKYSGVEIDYDISDIVKSI